MKASSLRSMFSGELSQHQFKLILSQEMSEYASGYKELGKSRPVYLDEDVDLFIGDEEVQTLCKAFLDSSFNELEINYIADALLLSNCVTFENEGVSDKIGYLTDPEINGPLTTDAVEKLMRL